jgi:hypothetical protein
VRRYDCLPRNPRKLKAFATALSDFACECEGRTGLTLSPSESYSSARLDPKTGLLLVMAYLFVFHADIYTRIEHKPGYYVVVKDWAEKGVEVNQGLFSNILLPEGADQDENKEPVPGSASKDRFHDPLRGGIFWIQKLVIDLGNIPESALKNCMVNRCG